MDTQGVALDSLPYIDNEYDDPAVREKVMASIQEEMGRISPPLMPKSTSLFKHNEILRKEYERVRAGRQLPPFDIERYKLEAPSGEDESDPEAWRLAAGNAASQLEHQNTRLVNLELLQQFGANVWKLSNYQKEGLLRSIEAATQKYQEEGVHINKARKYEQTEAGVRLRDLESRWSEGVRKCVEIQAASSGLQAEIDGMETALAGRSQ
ncbi:breast carcinoma amplified sequence 2 [Martensiomyces pterosporus]|nr:breast carcinoma amplified sequence 2 [Martensiomyces pterosporus]